MTDLESVAPSDKHKACEQLSTAFELLVEAKLGDSQTMTIISFPDPVAENNLNCGLSVVGNLGQDALEHTIKVLQRIYDERQERVKLGTCPGCGEFHDPAQVH